MVNTSTSCTVQKRRRQTCDTSSVLRKGSWTAEEDELLKKCVQTFGEGKWHLIPLRAGLNRCRKSCRLRWLNYLKPGIRRGKFDEYEVDLVLRIHKLLGNRWALIAGRIPGRTANDVKNYWNTHLRSHSKQKKQHVKQIGEPVARVIKPIPCTLSKSLNLQTNITAYPIHNNLITSSNDGIDNAFIFSPGLAPPQSVSDDKINEYINKLLDVEKEADDEVGWPFHGFSAQGLRVEGVIGEQDGQNNLLDFPVEEADIWDLLASEQL